MPRGLDLPRGLALPCLAMPFHEASLPCHEAMPCLALRRGRCHMAFPYEALPFFALPKSLALPSHEALPCLASRPSLALPCFAPLRIISSP